MNPDPYVILYTDADVFAGTERHMLDLALALLALGVDARIGCPRPGALAARADAAGVPVIAIPKQGRIDRHAIGVLAGMLCGRQVDIVHAHNGRTHITAAAAVKKAGRGACIATQHFIHPARTTRSGPKAWIAAYLHHRATAQTARIVAISDAVREAAIARGDAPPGRITTVLNGSNPPDVANSPPPAKVFEGLGIPEDAPLILCAARLQEEKDIPTLIAAMRQVCERHAEARCLVAGEGDLRPALERQIAAGQLQERVRLLGFHADVPGLIRACDLFVLPSPAEPFGLVLLEAMALGRPVIATDSGGPREIVAQNQTGLLVPPKNPAALAEAICCLINDPQARAEMGAAGEARYRAQFTAARMAREMLALYHEVLPPTETPIREPLAAAAGA